MTLLPLITYYLGMALGTTIRRLREARGLTQGALARRAGISRVYVAVLEGGYRANPSVAVRKRLAKALGVSVMELLE